MLSEAKHLECEILRTDESLLRMTESAYPSE